MNVLPAGSIIATRYEVVQGPSENRHLQGGMGMVYLCRDQVDDKPVALKTFHAKYLANRKEPRSKLRGIHENNSNCNGCLCNCLYSCSCPCFRMYVAITCSFPSNSRL